MVPNAHAPDRTAVPDQCLVEQYRAGTAGAADVLYQRYARRLRAIIQKNCGREFTRRFDADDVIQSAFRMFFDGARKQEFAALPGGDLWGLLVTLAFGKLRTLVQHHTAAMRDVRATGPAAADPAEFVARDESAAAFLRMVADERIDALPAECRSVVRLRMDGYEVAEIAARTGQSPRTVERLLQRCRVLMVSLQPA